MGEIMEHGGGHEIGAHNILEVAGMQFHLDTLIMTWIVMAIIIVLVIGCTRKLSILPGGAQNFVEMLLEPIMSQIDSSAGKKGHRILPVVVTIFLFVLFSNLLGLIPGMAAADRGYQHNAGPGPDGHCPCPCLWTG